MFEAEPQHPESPDKPSISDRKLQANRRNAEMSTGPKTLEGKAWSCRNALKDGLTSSQVWAGLKTHAEKKQFERLLAKLHEYYQPTNVIENTLVEKVATCLWRQRQIQRTQNWELSILEVCAQQEYDQQFSMRSVPHHLGDKLLRYDSHCERQMYKAIAELECRKADRLRPEQMTIKSSGASDVK